MLHGLSGIGGLDLARADEEEIAAQAANALGDALLGALAYRHQGDDRADADDDAQHGESGAHLVGGEGNESGADGVEDAHAAPSALGVGPWGEAWLGLAT